MTTSLWMILWFGCQVLTLFRLYARSIMKSIWAAGLGVIQLALL